MGVYQFDDFYNFQVFFAIFDIFGHLKHAVIPFNQKFGLIQRIPDGAFSFPAESGQTVVLDAS